MKRKNQTELVQDTIKAILNSLMNGATKEEKAEAIALYINIVIDIAAQNQILIYDGNVLDNCLVSPMDFHYDEEHGVIWHDTKRIRDAEEF